MSYQNFNEHKVIAHSIEIVKPDLKYSIECLEFENIENFNIWKNEIEQKTKSCYIKNCGCIMIMIIIYLVIKYFYTINAIGMEITFQKVRSI